MNNKLVWGIVAAIVVLVAIFAAQGPGGNTIKFGVLVPLTGDAASYGESESRAIQVAVQEINTAGGILGKQIELVLEDGKCDPQAGGTAAQKLVNVDKVRVIFGGACSGETLAAAKITEPAKVILISPSASSPKVSEAGDFVFRTYPSDALAGKIAATYAYKELKAIKAALITETTDYAQGLREVYKATFTSLGGTIAADETFNTGDADFRTQVLKVKTAKIDVVYVVPQSLTPGIQIFKQLRESGVTAKFTTAEVLLDRQGAKDNTKVLEGIYGVEPAVDYVGNAKAAAFRDAHRGKFNGADPGSFAANSYDAVYVIKAAVEAAGGLDTVKIRDFLYGVKDWPGAIGKITIDENGDPILGLNVRRIVQGEVTDVGPYTP